MEETKYLGRDYPIHDAWSKVSGAQTYTGDMHLPHMYYARILFSDIPHGNILSIDVSKAEALDGVIGVFTHENTPTKTYNNFVSIVGQDAPADERLFTEKVRFVGDRVAAVVAVSQEIAQRGVDLIDVQYEQLPPIADLDAARAETAPKIHREGNLLGQAELHAGDAAGLLQRAEDTYETRTYIPRIHHAAMENHVCIAEYNRQGELTVWTPCQGAYGVRHNIASFLEMNYSDVRVIKTTTGGSFGGKQQSILELFTAWLARKVGGAVHVGYDRPHSMLSTSVATAFDITVRSALSPDKEVLAMDLEAIVDAGAYATNSTALPYSAGKKAFRLYKIPNMRYRSTSFYTNAPVAGGFRGWGGPQVLTAMETHMEHVARKNGMDPLDFRIKNLVDPQDVDPCTGLSLGNAHIKDCLQKGAEAFGWRSRNDACKHQAPGRFRRGVGLACGAHMNGYFGGVHDFADMILKMNEDGTFILNTAVHDQGCGTLTSLAIIVAEVLDVPVKKIKVLEADTQTSPYDMGTYSSRVTYVSGRCAYEAAQTVRQMIIERAAIMLGKPAANLFINNEFVCVKGRGGARVSFRQVASAAQTQQQFEIIAVQRYENGSNPGSYGCHFAEVEIDTLTGLVRVVDYLAAHDLGCALNRSMVEGQIQGAVQTGIGYALCEEVELDKAGYPTATNFDKYTLVNSPDMPDVRTLVLEYAGDDGPFGAKSIGEAALIPVAAAVVNAVNHALGTDLSRLPLTPKRIIASLYGERKA